MRKRKPSEIAFDKAVGARVRERRQKLGLMLKQVSDQIGVDLSQLARYETGDTPISTRALARIAAALKCNVADFLNGIEVRAPR